MQVVTCRSKIGERFLNEAAMSDREGSEIFIQRLYNELSNFSFPALNLMVTFQQGESDCCSFPLKVRSGPCRTWVTIKIALIDVLISGVSLYQRHLLLSPFFLRRCRGVFQSDYLSPRSQKNAASPYPASSGCTLRSAVRP